MIRTIGLALLLAATGHAADKLTIADAAFLAGTWETEALGGWCEEIWSAPRAGAMMSVFRMIDGEKTRFYEIAHLTEENGGLRFRLKHFDASLRGWEEKDETVEFPFVRSSPGLLEFEGITFRKIDDDHVTVTVAIHEKDGSTRDVDFVYRRSAK